MGEDLYGLFALTGDYATRIFYSPLFRALYLPFALLGNAGFQLWHILMFVIALSGIIMLMQYRVSLTPFLAFSLAIFATVGNLEPLLSVLILYCYVHRGEKPLFLGFLLGFSTMKIVNIIAFIWFLWQYPHKRLIFGFFLGFALNWIWFFPFPELFQNLLGNILNGNFGSQTLETYWWEILGYPWVIQLFYSRGINFRFLKRFF